MAFHEQRVEVVGGLSLAVRLYSGGDKTPAICIPGLTRNAADFEELAPKIAATGRNAITVSLRGRGASDHDPQYLNYHPETYRDDIFTVLDAFDAGKAIFIGTSLGGIITMLANQQIPSRVCAAILNDVGPELAPEGIARIASYVGTGSEPAATLEEAAARSKAANGVCFPDASNEDWLFFARRTFRQTTEGKWVLDYDPNIARALIELGPAPDLWPAFQSLKDTPGLIIRGELSDLLAPDIVGKMREACPDFEYAEIPRIGHAPMMTEPVAWSALQRFLKKID